MSHASCLRACTWSRRHSLQTFDCILYHHALVQSLFRKEVIGKLPFLENPQKLAVESISAMMRDLEQKLNVATRDPAAVSLGMMNNLRFILAAVSEHDQLPTLLGSAWVAHQEKKLANFKAEYFQSTWAPLVDAVAAGTAEAANVSAPLHCSIASRLSVTGQLPGPMCYGMCAGQEGHSEGALPQDQRQD